MPDNTYQAKVYEKQGGDEIVVASGGVITVEAGGAVVETVATPTLSTIIPNIGLQIVGSSSGATTYGLADPVAGKMVELVAKATLGGDAVVTSTAGIIGDSTGSFTVATFSKLVSSLSLRGINATNWAIIGKSTGVALT